MEFNVNDGPFSDMAGTTAFDDFPAIYRYDDAREFLWNSPESELMFGVDGQLTPVTVDLASDTPHVLVSAGSGAGKSVVARSMATQALVKGASVAFLDVKRISHRWSRNLPEVTYACAAHEIGNVLVSIGAELQWRNRVIESHPGSIGDATRDMPRIVIVAEELNSMMEELKEYEKGLPRANCYKPTRAFSEIMNMGRAAKIHVVAFAQYPDYTVVAKRLMESFGYRILLKHTHNMWNLLVPHAGAGSAPPASRIKGRGYVVMNGEPTQTQFLLLEEEECAELVRTAHDARVRMGMIPDVSKRDVRRHRREVLRELVALERG